MSWSQSADLDPQIFLNGLVDGVTRALQPGLAASVMTVERARSLGDRLAGRPGTISSLRLISEGETLSLTLSSGPRWKPELERVSGGVTISRRTLPLGEWLNVFAGRIAVIAADAAGDAASSARALQALGIQTPAAGIRVSEASLEPDLRNIRAQLHDRLTPEAEEAVGRIAELLLDTLPRVADDAGESQIIVRRTATVYLPDTLRTFLALPADWAQNHVFPDGSTPALALLAQLIMLETAVLKMRDAAVQQDASALLVNGRFLNDRFAVSSLDLP